MIFVASEWKQIRFGILWYFDKSVYGILNVISTVLLQLGTIKEVMHAAGCVFVNTLAKRLLLCPHLEPTSSGTSLGNWLLVAPSDQSLRAQFSPNFFRLVWGVIYQPCKFRGLDKQFPDESIISI